MPRAKSQISAILNRVKKVTQQTTESLRNELRRIEDEKIKLTSHLDDAAERIRDTLSKLGIGAGAGTLNGHRAKATKSSRKSKRIRRSPEQLKQEARAILDLIKSKGDEGATGSQIRERHPKIGPDIKGFMQKFSGRKLKTAGKRAGMRYFVA